MDTEARSVKTEMYYCKKIDINKAAIITKNGDIITSGKLYGA
jgi:hypothetical protein